MCRGVGVPFLMINLHSVFQSVCGCFSCLRKCQLYSGGKDLEETRTAKLADTQ